MRIEGFQQMMPALSMAGNGSEAVVEREIQTLQRDLNKLEQKQELTTQEQKKKRELEKQIADLKWQL